MGRIIEKVGAGDGEVASKIGHRLYTQKRRGGVFRGGAGGVLYGDDVGLESRTGSVCGACRLPFFLNDH